MLKVTILIPTYNQENVITDAIESALKQTYPHKEILIVDDSTNDNTAKIVKKYDKYKEFRYIKNPKNLGRVQNYRNALYNHAGGDYLLNLDGDDFLTNNTFVEDAIKLIEKHNNEPAFVFGNITRLDESTGGKNIYPVNKNLPTLLDGNALFINYSPKKYGLFHMAILYNIEKAKSVGFYQHDINSSDLESILKLCLNNKVCYLDEVSGVWRIHSSNASQNLNIKKAVLNIKTFTSSYKAAKKLDVFKKSDLRSFLIRNIFFQIQDIGYRMLNFLNWRTSHLNGPYVIMAFLNSTYVK